MMPNKQSTYYKITYIQKSEQRETPASMSWKSVVNIHRVTIYKHTKTQEM